MADEESLRSVIITRLAPLTHIDAVLTIFFQFTNITGAGPIIHAPPQRCPVLIPATGPVKMRFTAMAAG